MGLPDPIDFSRELWRRAREDARKALEDLVHASRRHARISHEIVRSRTVARERGVIAAPLEITGNHLVK